jgi:hypothetical protein
VELDSHQLNLTRETQAEQHLSAAGGHSTRASTHLKLQMYLQLITYSTSSWANTTDTYPFLPIHIYVSCGLQVEKANTSYMPLFYTTLAHLGQHLPSLKESTPALFSTVSISTYLHGALQGTPFQPYAYLADCGRHLML